MGPKVGRKKVSAGAAIRDVPGLEADTHRWWEEKIESKRVKTRSFDLHEVSETEAKLSLLFRTETG
jgi:hypothetical protein